ncbi:hypothetical protein [Novipirellula rosea]|uniref:Uncharacterized protein n=1 Tax=Novipirellula rosea TaxID=1031540 RepID=A0ABP8NQ62_9BACT
MRHFILVSLALYSVQLAGCPASSTIEHGNVSFDVSPNGETIVFSDANGDLWLYALGIPKLTRLTDATDTEMSEDSDKELAILLMITHAEADDLVRLKRLLSSEYQVLAAKSLLSLAKKADLKH